jgi:ferritin-like metal-binding protein YciE
MNEFFVAELQRLYGEEKHVVELLPKLGRSAASVELKTMFTDCTKQATEQMRRLERIFEGIDEKARARECPRVDGLCRECESIANLEGDPQIRDVALIATSQHVTHDQIAGYGCARSWARILGKKQEADLLQTILDDKKQLDGRFTQLAEKVNREATALTT